MSLTELKTEIAQLSRAELEALRSTIDSELTKKQTSQIVNFAEYAGCARGMMKFNPGWDDPEPIEQWNALRADTLLARSKA